MKSMPFLFLFLALISLTSFAQDMDADDIVDSTVSGEDLLASEEIAALTENAEAGEIEAQEDMIHPEGENDWSLGGEDLPAEEFE